MSGKSEHNKGLLAALGSMVLWGILPIYWKSLSPISSSVVIFYRVVLVCASAILVARRSYSWFEILAPLRDRKKVVIYLIAGILITINWSTYIWAVSIGKIIQTSIGYYIEPLMICLFGILIFHERLTRYNIIAMLCALAAVILILIHFGELPTIALMVAFSFSLYSVIKKTVSEPPIISLINETVFLSPLALVAVIILEMRRSGAIGVAEGYKYLLLILAGFVTVLPLVLFAYSATRIPLFTLGLLQYINPTIQLAIGILIYDEAVDSVQIIAFVIIWIGLAIFSYGEYKSITDTKRSGEV